MSAWHFNTRLVPASGLIAHHGAIPKHVEVVGLSNAVPLDALERRVDALPDYWEAFESCEAVETALAGLLPERDSWNSLARMFGESSTDEIVIWCKENGHLSRVAVSFSLGAPNPVFIRDVLGVASRLNLKLVSVQSQEVFAHFINQTEQCSAARFLPSGTHLATLLQ